MAELDDELRQSVSCAVMPAAASASFSPISSVTIDLTLTTSRAPVAATRPVMMRLASSASLAQCTVPPRAWTWDSSSTRQRSRLRIADALTACPALRSASQSGSSAVTLARLARMVAVAAPMFRRS